MNGELKPPVSLPEKVVVSPTLPERPPCSLGLRSLIDSEQEPTEEDIELLKEQAKTAERADCQDCMERPGIDIPCLISDLSPERVVEIRDSLGRVSKHRIYRILGKSGTAPIKALDEELKVALGLETRPIQPRLSDSEDNPKITIGEIAPQGLPDASRGADLESLKDIGY